MGSGRRFLRLPFREQACFLQALLLLPLTVFALRWMSVQRWQSILARLAPLPLVSDGMRADALNPRVRATLRMLAAAARRAVPRPTCLHHSLVLWWLLRRQGIGSELRIGGRKEGGRFEAHAWVEVAGQVLNENGDVRHRFAPFDRAIAPGEARLR